MLSMLLPGGIPPRPLIGHEHQPANNERPVPVIPLVIDTIVHTRLPT